MVDDAAGWVRYALAVTLLVAAGAKARDLGPFIGSLRSYGLGGPPATAAAAMIIVVEVAASAVSFAATSDVVAGMLCAVLGLFFTAAQTYLLATGQRVSCLCFGARSADHVSPRTWGRAVVVLLSGLFVAFAGSPTRAAEAVTIAGGVLLFAAVAIADRSLRARRRQPV
ncbi:MauE/DoxX family redox-associated membrane protein [Micromonospora sp. CA-263727]|uniref:MauE/DoxX family redox-associated membrane protein n=1 Tax=Micromonospora sp. CA-263727 TaxID=3239967 RepID=UPI003D8E7F52